MFLDNKNFPFVSKLEGNWRIILNELRNLPKRDFQPWPERHLYRKGWHVFGLIAFGKRVEPNWRACPKTTNLVTRFVPSCYTLGFSWLDPRTHIKPHLGYTKAITRCHLGLVTPIGARLRVANETRVWQEGKMIIFDDTSEHEAWNNSEVSRVVLLFDIKG